MTDRETMSTPSGGDSTTQFVPGVKGTNSTEGTCVLGRSRDNIGQRGSIGTTLPHHLGHYLGLEHETGLPSNLTYPTASNRGKLYGGQGGVRRIHFAAQPGCPS